MTTSTPTPPADAAPAASRRVLTVPNQLTFGRMLAIPAIVGVFYLDQPYAAFTSFALFVAASLTDFFDGFLARKLDQVTQLGTVLDPVADKLIVAAALVMLAAFGQASPIAVAAILSREVLIQGMREALAGRLSLKVSWLAKSKTAIQMSAIAVLLIEPGLSIDGLALAGEAALWLAVLMTWASGIDYLVAAFRYLTTKP